MPVVLVIEYDGTDFKGFARQPGQRTVEGVLREVLAPIEGPNLEIYGAGRTDSGVHARGQTVHFESRLPIAPTRWKRILNKALPRDVRVRSARMEPDGFHARHSATARHYRYTWWNADYASPFRTRFACHEPRELDVARMNEAAQAFAGEHDFASFAKADALGGPTRRSIYVVSVRRVGTEVRFDVIGSGFMHGMVRAMAGAVLEVGLHRRDVNYVMQLLEGSSLRGTIPVQPAHGLCLMKVYYDSKTRFAGQLDMSNGTGEEDE